MIAARVTSVGLERSRLTSTTAAGQAAGPPEHQGVRSGDQSAGEYAIPSSAAQFFEPLRDRVACPDPEQVGSEVVPHRTVIDCRRMTRLRLGDGPSRVELGLLFRDIRQPDEYIDVIERPEGCGTAESDGAHCGSVDVLDGPLPADCHEGIAAAGDVDREL
jgi:hypothetical protein